MSDPGSTASDSADQPVPPPMHTFRVEDTTLSKDLWSIVVTESQLLIRNADGQKQIAISRADHYKFMDLADTGNRQILIVRHGFKIIIHVGPEIYDALDRWRGNSTVEWLHYDLRGFAIKLAIGILFFLPAAADIGRYFKDGKAIELQGWEGLSLGLLMIGIAFMSHFKPHRYVMLMDVAWWIALLLFHVPAVMHKLDIWTAFWVIFPILFAYLRYRIYWKHACRTP